MLSLMPDFASSSISLERQAASVMQESSSLHVQYSPAKRPVVTDKVSICSRSGEVQDPSFGTQTNRSLRRVQGRTSLHAQIERGIDIDTASDISSSHSKTASSVPTTPRTSLDSLEYGDNGDASIDQETYQLMRCLAEESPNLFRTFCILDLQLEGKRLRCATEDMLPIDRASDEDLFLDEEAFGTPYHLQTMLYHGQEMQVVPVAGALVDIQDSTARASHRWVGLIDLTYLMCGLDEDIWLTIAYEEMDKAGIQRTSGKSKAHPVPADSADQTIQVIQSLHRDYFVIGVTGTKRPEWNITMISPKLSAFKDIRRPGFLDVHSMTSQLNVPLRFTTQVSWSTPGLHDQLYCIPMSGPKLVCWLCFLVDSELPDLWPSLETGDTEYA